MENNQRALWRTLRDLRQAVITDVRERAARLPENPAGDVDHNHICRIAGMARTW
ncbi:hypothetical protein [Escherichia coli]|uniref:hypothetical protein n=1 Tax=Escherichia coli TaxID=562 RepID=UPI002FCD61F5